MDIKSGLKTRPTVPGLRVDTFTVGADHLIPGLHRDPRGGTMPYRFFAPRPAAQRSKVPLVLFLHGLGEAGTDNLLQLSKNREPLVFVQPAVQANRPCFFVAPQHPPGHDWFGGDYERPSDSLRMAVAIVDRIAADYPSVDPDRIYVTGLSSGGIGAWDAMGKYPHKFAAAVPISAGCDPLVLRVKQGVSVWAFYNEGDELF
jgi:predicted peptidase